MDYINVPLDQEISVTGLVYDLGSLYDYLSQVTDTRQARGKRYELTTLLVLIVLAKLAGQQNPSQIADWVAYRLDKLRQMHVLNWTKAPSHMTYRRVLATLVSAEELERLMSAYQQQGLEAGHELLLSMDGKTLRGTIPAGETRGVHLLAVYVPQQGLVLGQAQVDGKQNEISVAPKLLEQVPLEGAIVLGDALHTQRAVSKQIVEAGGDFIWKVKGNQARTEWAIEKLFVQEIYQLHKGQPLSKHCQMVQTVEKGHGRITKRTLLTSTQLNDYLDWPYVAQVFCLETLTIFPNGNQLRQVVFGLTSLSADEASPPRLLRLIRQYWGIESGLHYRRDVTLREDATRLSIGAAGENMAILNNLVIRLALLSGEHNLAKTLRRYNAFPEQALQRICAAPATL